MRILLGTGLLVVFGAAAASLGGCGNATESRAVADSTMVDLLVELHLASARVEITDRPLPVPTDSILNSYGIDSTIYVEAISYYASHPEAYSRVYQQVLDRLSAERLPVYEGTQADKMARQADTTAPQSDSLAPQMP